jgi:hypothetical protein
MPCSICVHPEREAMNAAFAAGQRSKTLAKRLGLARNTLWRHQQRCLGFAEADEVAMDSAVRRCPARGA